MELGDSEAAVGEVDAGSDPGGLLVLCKLLVDYIHKGLVLLVRDIDSQQTVDGLHLSARPEDDGVCNIKFTEEILPRGEQYRDGGYAD